MPSLEIEKQGTRTTYRHYIDGIAILNREDLGASTTWKLGFNLKDRLGSVVTLADDSGTVLEHRSYDPFGKPRQGDFIDAGTIQAAIAGDPHPEFNLDPLTDRGFTDHEHLDEQRIIHMNGRAYDYDIGRFTSVDPFIQAPGFSQSVNPYSYIMNSPLAGVDPSGYQSHPPEEETDVDSAPEAETIDTYVTTGSNLKRAEGSSAAAVSSSNGGWVGSGPERTRGGALVVQDGGVVRAGSAGTSKSVPEGGAFGPNSRAQNGPGNGGAGPLLGCGEARASGCGVDFSNLADASQAPNSEHIAFGLGLTTAILPYADGTVGMTSKGEIKFYSNNWGGNQNMRWIGRTFATSIAKPLPFVAIGLTGGSELQNIRSGNTDMQARGIINIGAAFIALVPGGQIPAAGIAVTSILVPELDSTIRTPGTEAKKKAAAIQDTGSWLRTSKTE